MDDIADIHRSYLETHPENTIGKSKVLWDTSTMALWVILVQKQSQNVGKCIYHENMDFICQAFINKARKDKIHLNFKEVTTEDDIW